MKEFLLSILVLISNSLCSQAASINVKIPFEKLWPQVVSWISSNDQIQTLDKASGLIQTKPKIIASGLTTLAKLKNYAIQPPGKFQVYDAATVAFTFMVAKSGNGSSISVTAHYQTVSHGLLESNVVLDWQSTGRSEQEILSKISTH